MVSSWDVGTLREVRPGMLVVDINYKMVGQVLAVLEDELSVRMEPSELVNLRQDAIYGVGLSLR